MAKANKPVKPGPGRPTIIEDDRQPNVLLQGNVMYCSIGKTVSLGANSFESVRVDLGESRVIGPKDDREEVQQELVTKVMSDLKEVIEYAKVELA